MKLNWNKLAHKAGYLTGKATHAAQMAPGVLWGGVTKTASTFKEGYETSKQSQVKLPNDDNPDLVREVEQRV